MVEGPGFSILQANEPLAQACHHLQDSVQFVLSLLEALLC